ncbi:hypothetical protein ABOZ94_002180 [Salmonella enterica]|uniref:hypothetical protein n=1 Tax=Salmonella enterica TaxID=28901 RepID=UPI000B7BC062|nr:hypothetical protein [Salmonella enterica]EAA2772470.1 hypothetical protein [Salmonella enterica subsp. diarizonae]ASO09254.1 hypothetical protein LFZ92_04515 [Salmonella enterica subsp. salamae serovar 57:z29:z42]EAW8700863.1 hypothetical protein [Salmonella enterica]ECE0415897.1 hypothetical protein [Salmonella enterica]ECZ0253017.1 hypothetical protein [Salmonella enterica subsp. diarizonae]
MHYSDYDGYGFKRDELQELADAMGVDLYTPIELLTEKNKAVSPVITEETKNNYNSEALILEIEKLKHRIQELENERPILLKEYRDDDPLYLAIQIRNREWANYDPKKDPATRGNQAAIKQELKERNISEIEATAIEKVACPIKR